MVWWVFFQSCLTSELTVKRDTLGISHARRERAGMSLVLHLFSISLVLMLPTDRPQPPPACLAVPGKSWISLPSPPLPLPRRPCTPPQGGLPVASNAICACTLPDVETPSSFTTSYVKFRPSRARARPAACCRSEASRFNRSHSHSLRQKFSPLQLPSFPALQRGRLLHMLSGMTRRRARIRDSQQRISTQASLVECTF